MIWRLIVLLAAAAPEAKVSAWVEAKDGATREVRFDDAKGAHVVSFFLSKTREKPLADGQRALSRDLRVTHTLNGKPLWQAKDFVTDCEFDLTLELLDGSVAVTDVDGDGEAEVSFAYQLGCRSDVSPLGAKLLLYEGATKYALRGDLRTRVGETEYAGGDFKADPAFEKAPALLAWARGRWKTLVTEGK